MTNVRGIAVAGAMAIGLTGAHAGYRSWPVTHGSEILVPAALLRQPVAAPYVDVRLALSRVALDVPHTNAPLTETFVPVRLAGDWWIGGGPAGVNGLRRRGRPLFLQLEREESPGAAPAVHAVTIADAPVSGALNLAGNVTFVRDDGYVWLDFGFAPLPVPEAVAANARPLSARRAASDPIPPAADAGVFAVLRVLPSGRATLTGVMVSGVRY